MTITDHEFVDLGTPTGPMRTFVFRPTLRKYRASCSSRKFSRAGPIAAGAAGTFVGGADLYEPPHRARA